MAQHASDNNRKQKLPRAPRHRMPLPVEDVGWRNKLLRERQATVERTRAERTFARVKKRALAEFQAKGVHPERLQYLVGGEETESKEEGGTETETKTKEKRETKKTEKNKTDKPKKFDPYGQGRARIAAAEQNRQRRQKEFEEAAAASQRAWEQKQAQRAREHRIMAKVEGATGRGNARQAKRKLGRMAPLQLDRVRQLMGK